MRFIILIFCFFTFIGPTNSQSYNTTAGITFNKYLGLTFKQRVADHTTIEAILARTPTAKNYTGSILAAQHFPMLTKRLNFFIGAGPHFTKYQFNDATSNTVMGFSAFAGLDFTIRRLNIAWDMQFSHNKYHKFSILEPETTISVRYVIIKRRSKIAKWFKAKKWQFWKKKKK